jgi:hypothetical protein
VIDHPVTRASIALLASLLLDTSTPCAAQSRGPKKVPDGAPIVLRGTILTADGVIKHGEVGLRGGRIEWVSEERPDTLGAVSVNTRGILLAGLVDVHNHVPWNVLPRWSPGRLFTDRSQWRADPEYLATVGGPFQRLVDSNFCDMSAWGELRALVGGTTSILSTRREPCIHGVVRNLDFNSGFYGTTELNRERILNVIDLPPADKESDRAFFVTAARSVLANAFIEAVFLHLAEGTGDTAEEEFTFLVSQDLLDAKGSLIHAIPLDAADFEAMALAGTALVWSPRSNFELYGQTTDIEAALDAGVEIALAPDWAVTGSSNLLDELAFGARWNRERLGGRLTDRELVAMVTSTPARIAGIDDEVGAIRVGLRADLLVIDGDHNQPYAALVAASSADVELVLVDGVPLYGDLALMEHFWERSELEEIALPNGSKTLATPAAGLIVSEIETRLQPALEAEGTFLAPLAEQ